MPPLAAFVHRKSTQSVTIGHSSSSHTGRVAAYPCHRMTTTATAVGATLVALAFSMSTFERFLVRRRRHDLAWSLALLLFAVASAALAVGAAVGWTGVSFRLFFLFGAIMNVPFLALGTVYLLAGPKKGDVWAVGVALASTFAAGVVTVAPFTHPLPRHSLARGSEVFGPLPRVLAATGSGAAALVVFGGALWSAWRFRRGRMVWANALIATGTAVTAGSGLLNSVVGAMNAFAVTLLAGISFIFAGFLVASAGARPGVARPRALERSTSSPPVVARGAAASRPHHGEGPSRS